MKGKQISGIVMRQKKVIASSKTDEDRALAFALWGGFLDGMMLSGAITKEEYALLYEDMRKFKDLLRISA